MHEIKLHHKKLGDHIHTTVFARRTDGADSVDTTYQKLGTLVMDIGQYQIIWAALRLGQEMTQGHLTIHPDEGWSPHDESTAT